MSLKEQDYFNQKLKVGHAYKFSCFNCEPANPWQQTLDVNTSLRFGKITSIDEIPAAGFPQHYFRFVAYNQLESRVPKEDETSKMQYPILTGKFKPIQFIYIHKRRDLYICALTDYIGSL